MARWRGHGSYWALTAAGAVALAIHGGAWLAAYRWAPRQLALGATEIELPPMDLAPMDEAEVRELLNALGPLPGQEASPGARPDEPLSVPAPTAPSPRALRATSGLPTRAAPALPPLSNGLDSESDEQIRVPALQRPSDPESTSAEGQVRRPRVAVITPVPARPVENEVPDAAVPEPRAVDAGSVAPVLLLGISESADPHHLVGGSSRAEAPLDPALALFTSRMNARVRAEWHPTQVYRQINPKLEGAIDPRGATTVEVRLRADGTLERSRVTERSGTPALDQEALAALQRAQPFSPPPAELIDGGGGVTFPFRFDFDLTVAAFIKQLTQRIREEWRPSPAFRRFGGWGEDRSTVLRILLKDDGTLVHSSVVGGSGIDLLDASALAALKVGTRLVPPAPVLRRPGSLVPVRVVFVHALRGPDLVYVEREKARPKH